MYRLPRQSGPTRRSLLHAAGAGCIVAAVGCDLSTDPAQDDDGGDGSDEGTDLREAPGLTRQVDEGSLPPLEERLPDEPLVVELVEQAGVYGGSMSCTVTGTADDLLLYTVIGYENLLRWTVDWTGAPGNEELVPNVATSFESNEDATEFTFTLRPGMKWSDGEPFTADDIVFTIEDVLLNTDINPAPPPFVATSSDEPVRVEAIDDTTFRIIFPEPSGLFLQRLATPVGGGHQLTLYPRHYLEEFHADYNPDVDQLAEDEGFDNWVELFGSKASSWVHGHNPELPVLNPWRVVTPFGEGERVVFERNPFYWKTDPDGRQLPYMDQVVFHVEDLEVALLRTMNGEIDLSAGADPTFNSAQNKPMLAQSREDGDYRFIDVVPTRMNVMNIHLNQTHQDPAKREVFGNKNFRIALSHAIDRSEFIDATMQRQGEPFQAAPLPDSPFYDEEFATQYLEFDRDLANQMLDEEYPDTNANGIRLGPDGNPIQIRVTFVSDKADTWGRMLELIKEYWAEVGVDLQLEPVDRSLWTVRRDANEHDAGVWQGGGGLDVILNAWNYYPERSGSIFAVPWGIWYSSGGSEGEEPSPAAREQMELFDQLKVSADPGEQARLMTELLAISKEQFYVIGTAIEAELYFTATNRLRNVPGTMLRGWTYPTPGPTSPEQYYIEDA